MPTAPQLICEQRHMQRPRGAEQSKTSSMNSLQVLVTAAAANAEALAEDTSLQVWRLALAPEAMRPENAAEL